MLQQFFSFADALIKRRNIIVHSIFRGKMEKNMKYDRSKNIGQNKIKYDFFKSLTVFLIIMLAAFAPLAVFGQKRIFSNDKDIQMPAGSLQLVSERPLGRADFITPNTPSATDPTSVYSNITTFTGFGFANTGAAVDPTNAANTITKLVLDDLTLIQNTPSITGIRFTVANFNGVAVSARPLIRIFQADGAGGAPGTILATLNFNPISFGAGSVATFTFNPGTTIFTPTNNKIWVGMVFDNNSGTTGATVAQLNNLGQGVFNPPTRGSSADLFFQSTTNGPFTTSNPAGSNLNFGGSPVANFGLELLTASVVPTAAGVNVSGRVVTANGRGIFRAALTLTAPDGSTRRILTNNFGYYTFSNVPAGNSYVIEVSAKSYLFDQPTRVFNLVDNVGDLDFIANP
jgi:hypothetical protein